MGIFNFPFSKREVSTNTNDVKIDKTERELRDVLLGNSVKPEIVVNRDNVMQIPTLASGVNMISRLIASLPIKLYEVVDGEVNEIVEDDRLKLLNLQSEKTMSAYHMKESLIKDYLLEGNGFIYIKKKPNRNIIESLHYVDRSQVSFLSNFNIIEKDIKIMVGTCGTYEVYDFINLCQNSKDGVQGRGVITNNSELLSTMLTSMKREKSISFSGGVSRGVLKSQKPLSEEAMRALKRGWEELYSDNNNALILSNGIDFQTVSSSGKDMELYSNKKANSDLVAEILNIPKSIMDGTASDEVFNNFVKTTINPILSQLEIALNNSLLFESEKGTKFFDIDTDELLKSDLEKRMKSYEIALRNSILTIDEVRKKENLKKMPNIGGLVKLSLADTLYNPDTNTVFNINSSTKTNLDEAEENPIKDTPTGEGGQAIEN
ncbi:phage portal protein [Clostridium tertium]|uniref:phage portal protein n=1 Tax=Clostridium tertium TaxID=1559 RepID=UPI0018A9C4D6|nr:phage portal protein [Clostridium tertium]MDB1970752.1 phage portal protein [Clostridium tertium]